MRFKFHKNAVAYTSISNGTAKVFFNSSISLPKKEKQPYIKTFDKLIPISVTQAITMIATTDILLK